MSKLLKELDVVALVCNIPEKGLIQGQVGTIVMEYGNSVYEVEFCDENGVAYEMQALHEQNLMLLHYSKVEAA